MIEAESYSEITQRQMERLIESILFGFQEKHNGERRLVCKDANGVRDFNREGARGKALPLAIRKALKNHPLPQFVLDVELVGDTVYLFDILYAGDENLALEAYEVREARYHAEFDGYFEGIVPVETARTPEAKRALLERLEAEKAEGILCKNMTKPYREGKANQHYKYKFWKSLDAVVMGMNPEGKDSVEIGVYDHGKLIRISGCALKSTVRIQPGDVIEVKYLYATNTKKIVQPSLLRKRTDKRPEKCTVEQLVIGKNFLRL